MSLTTTTLADHVTRVLTELINSRHPFSAFNVTQEIRNQINAGTITDLRHSNFEHYEVRPLVHDFMRNFTDYDVDTKTNSSGQQYQYYTYTGNDTDPVVDEDTTSLVDAILNGTNLSGSAKNEDGSGSVEAYKGFVRVTINTGIAKLVVDAHTDEITVEPIDETAVGIGHQ